MSGYNKSNMLIAFSHLVELTTVYRWITAALLGVIFSVEYIDVKINYFNIILGIFGLFFILCYVMAINDCFDVKDDIIKSKITGKKLVVTQELTFSQALLISILLLLFGLIISFSISMRFFYISIMIIVLSTLYSVPPIRYKNIFPLSTLGEYFGAMLPFLSGYVIYGQINYNAIFISFTFALITLYWRLFHESYFIEVDKLTGKQTFAIVYGVNNTNILRRICLIIGAGEILILFILNWYSIKFFTILILYLFFSLGFWFWLGDRISDSTKYYMNQLWGVIYIIVIILIYSL